MRSGLKLPVPQAAREQAAKAAEKLREQSSTLSKLRRQHVSANEAKKVAVEAARAEAMESGGAALEAELRRRDEKIESQGRRLQQLGVRAPPCNQHY
eukprot:COSAG01_NODE_8418_length_2789_cov_3.000000_3_plen_97_part_00